MEEEETGARSPLITFSHFLPHQVPPCALPLPTGLAVSSVTGAQVPA